MVILLQNDTLGQGIGQAASALGSALQQRGMQQQKLNLAEKERERQEQAQLNQIGALQQAFEAIESDSDPADQFSALLGALKQANVPLDPNTALNFYKTFGDVTKKRASEGQRTPEERTTFKENQKLLAGIAADAKTASNLMQNLDTIEGAIESGNISGPGLKGKSKRVARWLTGKGAPPEEQTLDTERKNAILALGDLKGIRLTDTKLRFIEDSLFNPEKSLDQNREAFRLYKQALKQRVDYLNKARELTKENEDILYDPTFSVRLQELTTPSGAEEVSESATITPGTFADLVRQRRGKR